MTEKWCSGPSGYVGWFPLSLVWFFCHHYFLESTRMYKLISIFCYLVSTQFSEVNTHGRLMNPPARNSLWRFGFPGPVNFNDNELFCGGINIHQNVNNGKCGLCGDEYTLPVPRPHEAGGKYGNAIITRQYFSGQDITTKVTLTSNHMGYFVFKMCPSNWYDISDCQGGQGMMDRHVVPVVHPNGTLTKTYIIESTEKSLTVELTLRLARGFNCTRCCFQWTYVTGNSWGTCQDGTEAMGCGKQETFINCADVSVFSMPSYLQHWLDPRLTSTSRANPYQKYYRDVTKAGAPMTPLTIWYQRCVSVDSESNTPVMNETCQVTCMKYPPNCPSDKCKCVQDVTAIGEFKNMPMADQHCLDQCNVYPAKNCDPNKCEVTYTSAL